MKGKERMDDGLAGYRLGMHPDERETGYRYRYR